MSALPAPRRARALGLLPEEDAAKVQVEETALPPLGERLAETAAGWFRRVLVERFGRLPPLGKVFIDERLKDRIVPFSQRSANRSLRTVAGGRASTCPPATRSGPSSGGRTSEPGTSGTPGSISTCRLRSLTVTGTTSATSPTATCGKAAAATAGTSRQPPRGLAGSSTWTCHGCLTKPFGVRELLARVRVALRHAARLSGSDGPERTVLTAGEVALDLVARRVMRDGAEVKLTKLEFDLLAILARNAGKMLTHRFLLKEVWGPVGQPETHTLRDFVANLRRKLEAERARPRLILTEQGVGYVFAAE